MKLIGKRSMARGGVVAAAATLALGALSGVAHAETDDAFSDQLWNLQQIRAEQAWPTATGEGVVVAVVDSGVDLGHPDLAGQLVPGVTTIGCGEAATCGDGDWVGTDGEAQDPDRHGTHVSGTIAAVRDNGTGVAGVAPDAKIMPVKALDNGSGSTEEIATGVRWAVDHGADVINMSLGGAPGTDLLTVLGLDSAWTDAVEYAVDNGVVVVAAAGNSTYPFCSSPANVQGVLCVTSTDRNRLPAYYSNLGLRLDLTGDTVAAPGGQALGGCAEDVLSTVPVGTGTGECGDADHDAMAGTSMASPAVAGVAALLVSQCRDRDGVVAALKQTAGVPLIGKGLLATPWYGEGIVNAEAAVASPGAGC
ncbi:S8 family serine peptidase [Nocardioides sambongensis]|uniref:S8 family serine peptidase n=1 Tax=Nocardioides sambongensis TaxID=2589074 RepID=UPI001E4C5BF2|nr:S8 family serine peptidase [Nocardioides sambongensis]